MSKPYITCYPNPATESINFNYLLPNGETEGVIKVYNGYGQLIQAIQLNATEGIQLLNMEKQADGLYFYTLLVNNKNLDKGKFVINR